MIYDAFKKRYKLLVILKQTAFDYYLIYLIFRSCFGIWRGVDGK